ncbi:MAG TPA: ACP S-malonyltransferase, partial [Pyrinomonadaceae bacterium]|nr:ACP S-malonyltransferase [Pyrinomonadaceae bacterium]
MTTFVFPGQGSQKKGMGAGLFEKFVELTAKADAVLGYSVSELCLKDPHSQLTQTQFTQPALFVVNALSYLSLVEEKRQRPDFVAGHSLGEYNALFAAGAFDFETGLRLVKRRGELMSRISGGGMAAVVGIDEATFRRLLKENGFDDVDIANFNAPGQVIISGLRDTVVRTKPIFEAAGARFAQLQVSGAFHSRQMVPTQQEFSAFLRQFDYQDLQLPVV